MNDPRREAVAGNVLPALGVFVAAVALRWARLDLVVLNSDTVGPYLKAWTILSGDGLVPVSHAAESGPGLYWISTVFLVGADSLREAFARRYLLQAAVAPLIFFALVGRVGRPTAFLAGALLAASSGLLQTLDSGYQGYLAPDVAALVVAGLVLGLRDDVRGGPVAWALPAVPLAMMCHPFAAALVVPVVVGAVAAWRAESSRPHLIAGVLAALGLGLVRLAQLADGPGDGYLWDHAVSNSSAAGPLASVAAGFAAVPRQDGLLAAALLVAPVVPAVVGRGGTRLLARLYLAAVATLALAGGIIGYLQPYHLRILLPFAVAVGALALAEAGSRRMVAGVAIAASVAALTGGAWTASRVEVAAADLDVHAALGEAIATDAGEQGRWIEFATIESTPFGSPAALVLDGLLRGRPIEPLREPGPLFLVVAGAPDALAGLGAAPTVARLPAVADGSRDVVAVRFDGPSKSVPWTAAACASLAPRRLRVERRAADWLTYVRPGYTDEFTSRWFDPCVR